MLCRTRSLWRVRGGTHDLRFDRLYHAKSPADSISMRFISYSEWSHA